MKSVGGDTKDKTLEDYLADLRTVVDIKTYVAQSDEGKLATLSRISKVFEENKDDKGLEKQISNIVPVQARLYLYCYC
jgi:hypothetical protein